MHLIEGAIGIATLRHERACVVVYRPAVPNGETILPVWRKLRHEHLMSDEGMREMRQGDPAGHRLARDRANLLAEAERVARVLEILLQRANYPSDEISTLISDIAHQERSELQKAYGRIEPRRRFKARGGQPLQRRLPITHLYVDESGKSHVRKVSSPEYFALGAVAIGDEEIGRYRRKSDDIKDRFFGRTDFQFHDPYMRNRVQTRDVDYGFAGDLKKQQALDEAIQELMSDTDFMAFGVAIRKTAFSKEFLEAGVDPYLPTDVYSVAITLLLERFIDALAHADVEMIGRVRFENQGPKEDAYYQLEYARVLLEGTQWISAKAFQSRLETGLRFSPKSGSDPSELSDFFARDLYEWVRDECLVNPKWWDVFSSKVYVRGDGLMGTFGIKVFPDSDIRDQILAHRQEYGAREA